METCDRHLLVHDSESMVAAWQCTFVMKQVLADPHLLAICEQNLHYLGRDSPDPSDQIPTFQNQLSGHGEETRILLAVLSEPDVEIEAISEIRRWFFPI